jgi:ABC-type taurine transport system ATPase subunit
VSIQPTPGSGLLPIPGLATPGVAGAPVARKGGVRIVDAVKMYGVQGAGVLAVDHCTFDVPAGEITVVVGPSGCGKTTLLNAIAGFHSLSGGSIYLDDEMLCGPGKLTDRIVVFQNGALFPWKTNIENIAFGPRMQGLMTKAEAYEKARVHDGRRRIARHREQLPLGRFPRVCAGASRSSAR